MSEYRKDTSGHFKKDNASRRAKNSENGVSVPNDEMPKKTRMSSDLHIISDTDSILSEPRSRRVVSKRDRQYAVTDLQNRGKNQYTRKEDDSDSASNLSARVKTRIKTIEARCRAAERGSAVYQKPKFRLEEIDHNESESSAGPSESYVPSGSEQQRSFYENVNAPKEPKAKKVDQMAANFELAELSLSMASNIFRRYTPKKKDGSPLVRTPSNGIKPLANSLER